MSVPASRAQAFHWRRNLLALCLAAISGSAFSTTALATDAYPSKPVTLVTSFSVGSGPDTVLRLVEHAHVLIEGSGRVSPNGSASAPTTAWRATERWSTRG